MSDIKNDIVQIYKDLLPYSEIQGNNVRMSTMLNKAGRPLAIINPKNPLAALWLIVTDKDITIKVIDNSLKKFSGTDMWLRLLKIVDQQKELGNNYTILIDDDQSGGWWDKIIAKYGNDYDIRKNPMKENVRRIIREEIKKIINTKRYDI